MLEDLSVEITLSIARHLGFYSKLNLVKTCCKLYNKLYHTVLFEDLDVPSTNIDYVIDLFQTRTLDGKRVKRLTVNLDLARENYFPQLLRIFPNLKELYTGACLLSAMQMNKSEIDCAKSIRHTLESYVVIKCHESIMLLIENYQFTRLTHLCVRSYVHTKTGNHTLNIELCLMNAPVLKSLKMFEFTINIDLLETIHQSAPQLKFLEFYDSNVEIEDDEDDFPRSLAPFENMKSFKMTGNMKFNDTQFYLFQYIIQKYPNLESLDIDSLLNIRDSITYSNPFVLDNEKIYQYARRFLPQIIPRLKSFKMVPRFFGDYLEDMGSVTSHLEEIGFYSGGNSYNAFKDLRDLQYIQKLTFLNTLTLEVKQAKYLYHHTITVPGLKSLYIFDNHPSNDAFFNLDHLLHTYCNLKTLVIESIGTVVAISDLNHRTVYSTLHTLTLNVYHIANTVISFMNKALPKLAKISWSTITKPSEMVFDLPEHTIESMNLYVYGKNTYYDMGQSRMVNYELITDHGIHYIDFFRGHHGKRVADNPIQIGCRMMKDVVIICKHIWELREDNVIVFN